MNYGFNTFIPVTTVTVTLLFQRMLNYGLFLSVSDCLPVGGTVDADLFRLLSGGKPSRKCGIMSSGNHLFFSEDGLRMLVTKDLDLSNAR